MVRRHSLFWLVVAALLFVPLAVFAEEEGGEAHYPLKVPEKQSWSFSGPFGTYDLQQLQRGLKVYKEVCSTCHSLKYVAFRDLKALGYNEEQIKAFAKTYDIQDGPNSEGEMFVRKGLPTDYFPSPFPNVEAAKFANNGANPSDLSLMAKARAVSLPFPAFIADIFTNYNEAGPDYITALLTGYSDPPEGAEVAENNWYNPYFNSGNALAMPPPLSDGMVTYNDGTEETTENYARDVSAFLMWTADPHMETRKKTGFRVILFLIVFAGLTYAVKRRIWNELD
ncbi:MULTISPECIES: cytochrome c1 [Bartonella]|uniref:cytochrome c1 n=1 Tax=Bartonella TaxID=773 RepID=UPI0018DC563E|nr:MULTISPECIES: cytochrome c1 [Bartonella]MBH9976133.1 cytochrome c1 [Bartonella choladocola]MBI0015525.1 cytochrome c1 [Bartonella sp. B10834G3]